MVECRSDHDYAGRPQAFEWQGGRKIVEDVLESRRTPQGKFFRVRTRDNELFELLYDEAKDTWSIHQP